VIAADVSMTSDTDVLNTSVAAPPCGGNAGNTLPAIVLYGDDPATNVNANEVSGALLAASHS
jgi:hypothetical protein